MTTTLLIKVCFADYLDNKIINVLEKYEKNGELVQMVHLNYWLYVEILKLFKSS